MRAAGLDAAAHARGAPAGHARRRRRHHRQQPVEGERPPQRHQHHDADLPQGAADRLCGHLLPPRRHRRAARHDGKPRQLRGRPAHPDAEVLPPGRGQPRRFLLHRAEHPLARDGHGRPRRAGVRLPRGLRAHAGDLHRDGLAEPAGPRQRDRFAQRGGNARGDRQAAERHLHERIQGRHRRRRDAGDPHFSHDQGRRDHRRLHRHLAAGQARDQLHPDLHRRLHRVRRAVHARPAGGGERRDAAPDHRDRPRRLRAELHLPRAGVRTHCDRQFPSGPRLPGDRAGRARAHLRRRRRHAHVGPVHVRQTPRRRRLRAVQRLERRPGRARRQGRRVLPRLPLQRGQHARRGDRERSADDRRGAFALGGFGRSRQVPRRLRAKVHPEDARRRPRPGGRRAGELSRRAIHPPGARRARRR